MSKISLIIGREYFTRVKKKSFLITTLVVPLVIIGFYAIIISIGMNGSSDRPSIAVIDEGKLLQDTSALRSGAIEYKFVANETEQSFVSKYKKEGYDGFIYVPKINLAKPTGIVLHTPSNASITTMSSLQSTVNKAIERRRLEAQGIDPEKYSSIAADVDIDNTVDTNTGAKKSVVGVAFAVSFACGILIYMMMIIYGTQVMRGVTEEKTNRIAEVIISSAKPFELMMGKILGIGAVGLTQFLIWIFIIIGLRFVFPALSPDFLQKASMFTAFLQGFSSLPLFKIAFSFLFFFLGGYLTYASLFAAVGSVVSEDQQEAQQLVFPILMPIILGFVIMSKAATDPNSNLAVFGSIFPLTSPIVMMGRITYDIPAWQMIASVVSLIACFLLFTWITAKIYRTGILMYGKKPSWKEMMKWAFRKA